MGIDLSKFDVWDNTRTGSFFDPPAGDYKGKVEEVEFFVAKSGNPTYRFKISAAGLDQPLKPALYGNLSLMANVQKLKTAMISCGFTGNEEIPDTLEEQKVAIPEMFTDCDCYLRVKLNEEQDLLGRKKANEIVFITAEQYDVGSSEEAEPAKAPNSGLLAALKAQKAKKAAK